MDQDSTNPASSAPPTKWVSQVCLAALIVLTIVVIVLMVVGSNYGPPEEQPAPGSSIDTGTTPPPDAPAADAPDGAGDAAPEPDLGGQ